MTCWELLGEEQQLVFLDLFPSHRDWQSELSRVL
jgi:hypothetical protein